MIKKIIIDGVDVSGCEFYVNNQDYSCTCYDNNWDAIHCTNNLDCYYKQLQRKIVECEKLKADWQEMFEHRNKLNSIVLDLQSKLQIATEKLRKSNDKYKNPCDTCDVEPPAMKFICPKCDKWKG